MNASLPKTTSLSQTMADLLQQHSTFTVIRTLIATRLSLRQSRPPPTRVAALSAHLLRDIGLLEPRDPL